MKNLLAISVIAATAVLSMPASAQYSQIGQVVIYTPPPGRATPLDFANAQPMPLPSLRAGPPLPTTTTTARTGAPGFIPGGAGTGIVSPVQLAPAKQLTGGPARTPQEYGALYHVFTTSRVNSVSQTTSSSQPYSAAGKLFFNIGGSSYVCSAALIKPGIAVTAAHCVVAYGTGSVYTNHSFVPAYNNGTAPFGTFGAKRIYFLAGYSTGTDNCSVICPNDIAVIELLTPSGLPGNTAGFYGIGYDGYGENYQGNKLINQLGYPAALDSGALMQRTDSQSYVTSIAANNVIGSLQTGGSSGGPWLVNLGVPPVLSGGVQFGYDSAHNLVTGVTSWGYTNQIYKQQGASPFTASNIIPMVNAACATAPGKC